MMENPRYTISPEAIANGINDLLDEKEELQERIEKAIKYIENNIDELKEEHLFIEFTKEELYMVLDILKGSDKE